MTDFGTITWRGKSGREYPYSIYSIDTAFNAAPGNYVFAEEAGPGLFLPIYIGQTSDLSERFDRYHVMPCIKRNRAKFIHIHLNDDSEEARRKEASDLIARWDPPCNQMRSTSMSRVSLSER